MYVVRPRPRYRKLGFSQNETSHCFVGDNAQKVVSILAPIYRRLGWNKHELVDNKTVVSLKTTCTEIDECLETHHACGDPSNFKNPCADEINGYSCFCGNFTARGRASDPCDDVRMPHKTLHNNTCEWPLQWPWNDFNYKCTCDVGYYRAVDKNTSTLFDTVVSTGLEYCADVDDCLGDPCGHKQNICHDEFRNHTCSCAPGFYLDLNETTNRPMCVDVDECTTFHPSVCGPSSRDGLVSPIDHVCLNVPGSYHCLCAPGYRNNTLICHTEAGVLVNGTNGTMGGQPANALRLLRELGLLEEDDFEEEDLLKGYTSEAGLRALRMLLQEHDSSARGHLEAALEKV